jgi:hypothetical protein
MWVFPGGRLDPDDASHAHAAARETLEETGIAVDPLTLVPTTRWVTPPGLPSRYDARFFAAFVPPGTDIVEPSDEVGEWRWLTPAAALSAHAGGALPMWQPTVVTLQQLLAIRDLAGLQVAFETGSPEVEGPIIRDVGDGLRELDQPWAGGIGGRRSRGWLVGRMDWVVVDPADPTGESADAALAAAEAIDATIVGVALTSLDPMRHAGVEIFAAGHGLPVVAGPGASNLAPYPLMELRPGESVPFGDVVLTAREPGTAAAEALRPEELAYEGPDWVIPAEG